MLMNSCGMDEVAMPTLRVEKARGCWAVGVAGVLTAGALLFALPGTVGLIRYCPPVVKVTGIPDDAC